MQEVYKSSQGTDSIIVRKEILKTGRMGVVALSLDTGFEMLCGAGNLKAGKVVDSGSPTTCGVGYRGVNFGDSTRQERVLWKNMIHRCYSGKHEQYDDCSVAEEWLNMSTFVDDIRQLADYEKFVNDKWQLDKDIKVKGNRVYSKATCMFVSAADNITDGASRHPSFNNIYEMSNEKLGTTKRYNNMREFCREYGTDFRNVSRALNKGGRVKGWTVKKIK